MAPPSYPLRFEPITRSVMWGGRKLETHLGRSLPPRQPIGESWELADFDDPTSGRQYSSVVANGLWRGQTLRQAIEANPQAVLGPGQTAQPFPLLVKLLDAHQTLSVQVHPDEAAVSALGVVARPKTECWVILQAEPGACVYRGLRPGTTPEMFRRAAEADSGQALTDLLVAEAVGPGMVYFVPAGTVHAIGAGVMLAEFQQPSDTTYRLWDWNRRDPATGLGRELHLDLGLACVRWHLRPPPALHWDQAPPEAPGGVGRRLVTCPAFTLETVTLTGRGTLPASPQPYVAMGLDGCVHLGDDPHTPPVSAGDTVLIPAGRPWPFETAPHDRPARWLLAHA